MTEYFLITLVNLSFLCFCCRSHLLQLSQEAVQSLIGQLTHLKHGHCMTLQVLTEGQRQRSQDVQFQLSLLTLMFIHTQSLTGDRLPIMRKAVRVESKRKAILFVGGAGMLRLLTLAVSATETLQNINACSSTTAWQHHF